MINCEFVCKKWFIYVFCIYYICEVPKKLPFERIHKPMVNSRFIKAPCNRELNLLEVYIEFFKKNYMGEK